MHGKLEPTGELSWQSIFKAQADQLTQSSAAGQAGAGEEGRREQEAGRRPEGLQRGAAVALRHRSSRPEKDRPEIGRANRREHRLVTVLLDGCEPGFAPVAFCRSGDHASVAINKPRTDCRRRQHHGS